MKGLEALENWYNTEHPKPVEYCFHYNIIKKELKVLQILKEKKVNILNIAIYVKEYSAESIMKEYNIMYPFKKLTLEEMKLIADWLKEE